MFLHNILNNLLHIFFSWAAVLVKQGWRIVTLKDFLSLFSYLWIDRASLNASLLIHLSSYLQRNLFPSRMYDGMFSKTCNLFVQFSVILHTAQNILGSRMFFNNFFPAIINS